MCMNINKINEYRYFISKTMSVLVKNASTQD